MDGVDLVSQLHLGDGQGSSIWNPLEISGPQLPYPVQLPLAGGQPGGKHGGQAALLESCSRH